MTCLEALGSEGGIDAVDYDMARLVGASRERGVECEIVAWDDATVDWSRFSLCVIRSTWNYFHDRPRFLDWLAAVERVSRVANDARLLEWNTDKHYLSDVAEAGLPVVPTTFIEPGSDSWRPELEVLIGRGDVVVKPCVSAGSNDTERHSSVDSAAAQIATLLAAGRGVMLQPYLSDVDEHGETGLVFIDGVFSHAFGKGPILAAAKNMTGGLYAEEEITAREADPRELDLGRRVLGFITESHPTPLYARVDLLPTADGPVVIEIELTEPSLYFALGNDAAGKLADAVARRIDS